jgi:hypothetical protein
MAIKLSAAYSKKAGLPGCSSLLAVSGFSQLVKVRCIIARGEA